MKKTKIGVNFFYFSTTAGPISTKICVWLDAPYGNMNLKIQNNRRAQCQVALFTPESAGLRCEAPEIVVCSTESRCEAPEIKVHSTESRCKAPLFVVHSTESKRKAPWIYVHSTKLFPLNWSDAQTWLGQMLVKICKTPIRFLQFLDRAR